MVPVPMRILYYLAIDSQSLPENDREAARTMFSVALRLTKFNKSTMRQTIMSCLELANNDDIDTSKIVILFASDDE